MTSLGSMLLTKALGSNPIAVSRPVCAYTLHPSSQDSNLTVVQPTEYPSWGASYYSVVTAEGKKPQFLIYRGPPEARNMVGTATTRSLSSTTDLTLHGIAIRMKTSQLSGDFSLQCPQVGKLKWKLSQSGSSSMKLVDGSGTRLAQLRSSGVFGMGEKKLEVLVPCDAFLTDLIVLSAVVGRAQKKESDEAAGEVMQAVLGA